MRCRTAATSSNGAKAENEYVCPPGRTVPQALEAQRINLAELATTEVGIIQRYKPSHNPEPEPMRLSAAIRRYLDQTDTLKKPNTYRKYNAVLTRFDKQFPGRELQQISIEELNEFVIKLRKSGLSANTVLHNVIISAQFCRRNGRLNLTRELQLPEAIHFLQGLLRGTPVTFPRGMRFLGARAIFDVPVHWIPGAGSDVPVLERSQSETENRARSPQA